MPTYKIRIINSEFTADEEQDCTDVDAARRHALKGALAIGSEQALNGQSFFGAEVRIEYQDEVASRFIVTVGSSPLQ